MEVQLVQIENNQVVVSSRQIAKDFEKEHKVVLRSVREILAEQNCAAKFFYESTYDNRGKEYPEYLMNRDGFSLLVMGFTGSKALEWKVRYIQAFNAMEAKLAMEHQDSYMIADPIARALKWAEEEKKRRDLQATCSQQEQLIGELKPKADYTDKILQSKSLVPITAIAKDYGMSGQALNKILHGLKIIYRIGNQWLLYSKYQACGYTSSETETIDAARLEQSIARAEQAAAGETRKADFTLFADAADYEAFRARHDRDKVPRGDFAAYEGPVYVGVVA